MAAMITVILPVRNGSAYIRQAIDSVLQQSFRELELLVSDNGSTDDTREIVMGYADDKRVKLICQTENLTIVDHFNKCLDMVRTEYYMLLCHDDYLCNLQAFESAHNVLAKMPNVSAVYSNMKFVDGQGRDLTSNKLPRSGLIKCADLARDSIVKGRNLFGIPLLIRTSARQKLEYDEKLPYAADLDLSIAISRDGDIYRLPDFLIANRYHGKNASVGLFKLGLDQMQYIAKKQNIILSGLENKLMIINAWKAALQKWVFFKYLNWFRA